jgi:hypothetical protein
MPEHWQYPTVLSDSIPTTKIRLAIAIEVETDLAHAERVALAALNAVRSEYDVDARLTAWHASPIRP